MNRRKFGVFLTALILASATTARGDIFVPGWRNIEHTFEVTGLERAPAGTVFVLAPMDLGMGHTVIEPGTRFTYRAKYASPNLYALAGSVDLTGLDPKGLEESTTPRAVDPFSIVSSVKNASLIERMHSVYEFRAIQDGRILLTHVKTDRSDARGMAVSESGWSWPPTVLSALALAALVVMGVRLRRVRARGE